MAGVRNLTVRRVGDDEVEGSAESGTVASGTQSWNLSIVMEDGMTDGRWWLAGYVFSG